MIVIAVLAYPKLGERTKVNADGMPVNRGSNGQESVSAPGQVTIANEAYVREFGSPRLTPPPDVAPRRPSAPVEQYNPDTPTAPITALPEDSVVIPGIGALTRSIPEAEIEQFSNEQLCGLRNEYYVRRGYTFSNKTHPHLTSFFETEPWYATRPVQSYNADHMVPWNNFPANEKATINAIRSIERRRGSWHINHKGPQPFEELLPAGGEQ
jgi:hypothetical protein